MKIAEKIGGNNYEAIRWVKDQITNKVAVQRVLENLITLELVNKFIGLPEKVAVNLKGFLLGELLFETYEKPRFLSRNFRKYKLALLVFYSTSIVLFLTVFLIFIEQFFRLIKPENFIAIDVYIGTFFGYSWWSTVMTCFLIYLGLKQIWKGL